MHLFFKLFFLETFFFQIIKLLQLYNLFALIYFTKKINCESIIVLRKGKLLKSCTYAK